MDEQGFWELIERSGKKTPGTEGHAERLAKLLARRSAAEVIEFDRLFHGCLNRSYRWDLWAVAYIIHGGCSDDGFDYFRGWLIGQGREFFEGVLADPARAAERIKPGEEAECEELLYAANDAYQELTGGELPAADYHRERPKEPLGEPWDEEDEEALRARYPELWEKYS